MQISSLTIDGSEVPISKLVVVVGPNGAGKTTFLRDLYEQFINSTHNSQSSNENTKWENLLTGNFLKTSLDEWKHWERDLVIITGQQTNNEQPVFGTIRSLSHDATRAFLVPKSQRDALTFQLGRHPDNGDYRSLEDQFGRPFKAQQSALLPVESRFNVSNSGAGNLDTNALHNMLPAPFLARNSDTLTKINQSLSNLFNKRLFIEPHEYPQYSMYIGKTGITSPKKRYATTEGLLQQKKEYEEWRAKNDVGSVSMEGHGIRAAIELLYVLEDKGKKIVFIDEPELHIYPSTKYALGRIIASYAGRDKQIVLATHDADLLRGLLDSSSKATIVRLDSDRKVHVSEPVETKTHTAEALQAAFLDCAIVVEGVSDQYVYRNALELKKFLGSLSYQVIPAHGADRITEVLPYLSKLRVRGAVIVDYDVVLCIKKGEKLIMKILKGITPDRSYLSSVDSLVNEIISDTKGLQDRKKGLAAKLPPGVPQKIRNLVAELRKQGVFVCDSGGLEDWVGLQNDTSAESVYRRYRSGSESTYKGLTNFLKDVAEYLKS